MRIYFSKKVVGIVVLLVKNLAIQHPHHLLVLLVPNHVVVDAKELVVEDAQVLQLHLLVLLVIILAREVVIAHVVVDVKALLHQLHHVPCVLTLAVVDVQVNVLEAVEVVAPIVVQVLAEVAVLIHVILYVVEVVDILVVVAAIILVQVSV